MSETDDNTMIPIPIADLLNGLSFPVDLNVKLSESKYVCIVKAGEIINKSQLQNYKNKKIENLWVARSEFSKITAQTLAIAKVILQQPNVGHAQKMNIMGNATNVVFKEISAAGLDESNVRAAKEIADSTLQLIPQNPRVDAILKTLDSLSNELTRHSLAVSFMSVMIAQEMGWQKQDTLERLSLAALLHDIGLLMLPPELIITPDPNMSEEQTQAYKNHTQMGVDVLRTVGILSDDIVAVSKEHHELADGSGYPDGIRNIKQHPMTKVVALANVFVELTQDSKRHPGGMSAQEAIQHINGDLGQPFNKEAFHGLLKVVEKGLEKKSA